MARQQKEQDSYRQEELRRFARAFERCQMEFRGSPVGGALFLIPWCPSYRLAKCAKAYLERYLNARDQDWNEEWHASAYLEAVEELRLCTDDAKEALFICGKVRWLVRNLDLSKDYVRVSAKGNYYVPEADVA